MNRNALRAIILLGSLLATAQAQATASSAAFRDPAESVKFYNKGIEQRNAGELRAAAESFKKAIEIDPNWPLARLTWPKNLQTDLGDGAILIPRMRAPA